ncbi:hypothetical protein CDD83_10141 [Cordyceps sp. RAO-2017]|nr:hypothetical protein CDD83_10141 [Cordyceps sp. RAO-2017]
MVRPLLLPLDTFREPYSSAIKPILPSGICVMAFKRFDFLLLLLVPLVLWTAGSHSLPTPGGSLSGRIEGACRGSCERVRYTDNTRSTPQRSRAGQGVDTVVSVAPGRGARTRVAAQPGRSDKGMQAPEPNRSQSRASAPGRPGTTAPEPSRRRPQEAEVHSSGRQGAAVTRAAAPQPNRERSQSSGRSASEAEPAAQRERGAIRRVPPQNRRERDRASQAPRPDRSESQSRRVQVAATGIRRSSEVSAPDPRRPADAPPPYRPGPEIVQSRPIPVREHYPPPDYKESELLKNFNERTTRRPVAGSPPPPYRETSREGEAVRAPGPL